MWKGTEVAILWSTRENWIDSTNWFFPDGILKVC